MRPSSPPVHEPTDAYPARAERLEEVCAGTLRDMAGALAFSVLRGVEGEGRDGGDRPVLVAATRAWLGEHGWPYAPGLDGRPLLLAVCRTEAEALWSAEQALGSGAASPVVATVEGASLAQTQRLAFAAGRGGSAGVLLKVGAEGLSAARRRWRVQARSSLADAFDARAPGPMRLRVELVRSRSERPGAWMMEQDDETHRLRLVDRLAGDGLDAVGRAGLAA